jgi:tetratricopeptide (TPR) repeat protein
MSLMNDALRKKNRETPGGQTATGFSVAPPGPRNFRKWLIVLAALLLLGGAIFGGIVLQQSAGGASLLTKHPLPAQTGDPAATAAIESPATMPWDKTGSIPTEAGEKATPTPSESLAGTVGYAPPPMLSGTSASATADSQQSSPPSSIAPAEAMAEAPARVAATEMNSTPLEGDRPAPNESPRQASRAFEPGPDPVVKPPQPPPAALPRSRPTAIPLSEATSQAPTPSRSAKKTRATTGSDTDLFYQKALACHRSGRLAEAQRFYRGVLENDANHRQAMFNLAAVYIEEGYFNQAQPLLERLEKVSPRPAGVLLNLAIAAIGNDAPQTALDYLDRAQAAGDAFPWQIHFHRAVALAQLNRFPEALALYQQVESRRPDDYRVQFNLAVTYDALGIYPEALHYYEVVLRGPNQASESDRQSIRQRVGLLRRYLSTTPSQAKRQ